MVQLHVLIEVRQPDLDHLGIEVLRIDRRDLQRRQVALILISTGAKRPITSALNNLQGEFFVNNNLIAAGAILACVPPIIVYVLLQKQFIAGLTLGSTKG